MKLHGPASLKRRACNIGKAVMNRRHLGFGLLVALGVAGAVALSYLPPFTPAGTVEIRSLDTDSQS